MFLFVFYLGGNAGQSNIEVHDIQFVAAQTPRGLACTAGGLVRRSRQGAYRRLRQAALGGWLFGVSAGDAS